jgi:hypothetical protein
MILALTDVYGIAADTIQPLPPAPAIEKSGTSGDPQSATVSGAPMWIALVAILVGLRLAYEYAS